MTSTIVPSPPTAMTGPDIPRWSSTLSLSRPSCHRMKPPLSGAVRPMCWDRKSIIADDAAGAKGDAALSSHAIPVP